MLKAAKIHLNQTNRKEVKCEFEKKPEQKAKISLSRLQRNHFFNA